MKALGDAMKEEFELNLSTIAKYFFDEARAI
jgi:hypothetical protein